LQALKKRLDPRAYNGASMVGLNGVVIKSHGGADRVSFANAVRVALTEARNGVPAQISDLLRRVVG
jgi:glycerol-3-phosphate acyltransferase PlsX